MRSSQFAAQRSSIMVLVLLVLALANPVLSFVPVGGGTHTHVTITGQALLEKVTETCKAVADAAGHEFEPTGSSAEELVKACLGPTATGEVSGAKFHAALQEIYIQNGLVDRDFINSAPHHFNSEAFVEGRRLIIEGLAAIKSNIRLQNFKAARETLGRILHVLQDFYSHSNWVELGNVEPFRNLLRADLPLENLADIDTPTCSDCESGTCPNPILPNILSQKKLTSGYMGIFSSAKPKGKCSHGGAGDLSSTAIPRGGIHKDLPRADNMAIYTLAVDTARYASLDLLEDIRAAAGDNDFLRMMGIARSSVVCFVIDTTGSMSDDIAEARKVVHDIIDSKKGTQDEPSEYILVPFNDPDFGPMIRTTDPDEMKKQINALRPTGGGDIPELCLSGLQLALTGAPASSNIYVFTDASAKDIDLKDTIVALIRSTRSTVSFFLTGFSRRRQRSIRVGSFLDYEDLALASGGQAIRVSKNQLPQATDVILDTSTSALVTVLQRARNPGKEETFPFVLDESLKNVTIYITGDGVTFTLTNPSGLAQSQNEKPGKLGSAALVGNLWRIRLDPDKETGLWKINIKSTQPYTLKITGQSTITFIYDFVERFEGPHPGYAVITGRPPAGQPALLRLSVMGAKGPNSLTIKEVVLATVSNPETVSNSTLTNEGDGNFLVNVDSVLNGEFVVFIRGTDKASSNSEFQRQSTTQMSVSKVNIKAVVNSNAEPGKTFILPFTVTTDSSNGTYEVTARNDKSFKMTYPPRLMLITGKPTTNNLTIHPDPTTASGTDVTLTIDVKPSVGVVESNYIVLRLSVVEPITDFVAPVCSMYNMVDAACPNDVSKCGAHKWSFSANLTDTNGTGIVSISLRQGTGNLTHTSLSDPLVQAKYEASCCSEIAEIVAVDKVGNVGKCSHSIVKDVVAPVCSVYNVVDAACPSDVSKCGAHKWSFSANLTDTNGTGIHNISLHQGTGSLTHTSLREPVVQAKYEASCCSEIAEIVAVDKVGNVGKCSHSIVKDVVAPVCSMYNMVDACPDVSKCGAHKWSFSANLTDTNGTGIHNISLHQGTGNLTHTSLSDPVVQAKYEASCCSEIAEILVLDKVGNVGKCSHSIVKDVVAPVCSMYNMVDAACPSDVSKCGAHKWSFSANLTDTNGTGIHNISLHQGTGSLTHTSLSDPVVQAKYESSCCSEIAEIVAVDKVGNVGKCSHAIVKDLDPPRCQVVGVQVYDGECPRDLSNCNNHKWVLIADLTDGGGSGVDRIYLHHGNGDLNYFPLNASVIEVRYHGTCCLQVVAIRAVDKAGNVGQCSYSVVVSAGSPTTSLWLCLLTASLMAIL